MRSAAKGDVVVVDGRRAVVERGVTARSSSWVKVRPFKRDGTPWKKCQWVRLADCRKEES